MAQDSSQPAFWDARYQGRVMPWDSAGAVPAALAGFIERKCPGTHVLLPGCGSGYEIAYLLQAGFAPDGIDFSTAALAEAARVLGQQARYVRHADFFALTETYDWIYERAFLCALPRTLWPAYASAMAARLAPGGWLAGAFFLADTRKGPPFGTTLLELDALLGAAFDRVECLALADSLPVFAGHEYWISWRRRAG